MPKASSEEREEEWKMGETTEVKSRLLLDARNKKNE